MEGNPEGTPEPGDSVEIIREASEKLRQDYEAAGSLRKLSEMYGVERHKLRDMLVSAGIPIKSRAQAIKRSWEQDERREVQIEKITATWQDQEIRDKRLAHWDEPGERERQREVWLKRIEAARGSHGDFPPAERELHEALIRASVSFETNLPLPEQQYIVDVLLTRHSILIEADGVSHRIGNEPEKDKLRDEILRSLGYIVIRITYSDLVDGGADVFVASLKLPAEDNPVFVLRKQAQALGVLARSRRRTDR